MTSRGTVRVWHAEEGWGVLDSPATPGGCWAHYSAVHSTLTLTFDSDDGARGGAPSGG